jgi:hypothetical protein
MDPKEAIAEQLMGNAFDDFSTIPVPTFGSFGLGKAAGYARSAEMPSNPVAGLSSLARKFAQPRSNATGGTGLPMQAMEGSGRDLQFEERMRMLRKHYGLMND